MNQRLKTEEMTEIPVMNEAGEEVERYRLRPEVFTGEIHQAALWQAVRMYLANQRLGLAKTKTRGEVSGGGRKPWRQKHTGRARAGSIRSPLWRGGGKVFGPIPRDYSYHLPRKILHIALVASVRAKAEEGNLVILERLELTQPKTKLLVNQLRQLGVDGLSCLLVLDEVSEPIKRAAANLRHIRLATTAQLNAYEVLHQEKLIITKKAMQRLEERLTMKKKGE